MLEKRLKGNVANKPEFFSESDFATLQAVCRRLIPQPHEPKVEIASNIDEQLVSGLGKGWRYDSLPPDRDLFPLGLRDLNKLANDKLGQAFSLLDAENQDEVLTIFAQQSPRFFEELLAMAVEIYYSHPLIQQTIGYTGFADAQGWTHIGLNERESWESGDGS